MEEFKRIKGFEKLYLISNYGRIVSIYKNKPLRQIKQFKQHNDYLVVHLWNNYKRVKKRVHRLVAEHFIFNDDIDFKCDVHHKDEDKNNNRFDNLEWCAHSKNMEYHHH